MTTAYVAIVGSYESAWPAGVYATPEMAIAAHHKEGMTWTATTWAGSDDVPTEYRRLHSPRHTSWSNDKDWDSAVLIEAIDLVTDGPERQPDRRLRQVYREIDGGWDYVDDEGTADRTADSEPS